MRICVIGAGYVGLITAAGLAASGQGVTCVEKIPEKIDALQKGDVPFYEPGLKELLEQGIKNKKIKFTVDMERAANNNQLFIVCVGTPALPNGQVDLSQVYGVLKVIYSKAEEDAIIVMKSTVPPGTGLRLIREIMTNHKQANKIEYVSNPEFLREGQAVQDWFNPDRIVIGAKDKAAAEIVKQLYNNIKAPVLNTDITSAEIIKYASNAFLTMKVSFINEVANLCDVILANIDDVAYGVGLDKRIGHSFLKAGIGYGGSCFPKDSRGLDFLSAQYGYDFHLLNASIRVNGNQKFRAVQKLLKGLGDLHDKKIALYGLSFKPHTDDVRESISLELINILLKEGAIIQAYDPVASGNAEKIISSNHRLIYARNAYENAKECHALVLVTEWPQFADLDWKKIKDLMFDPYLFIDGRNFFNPVEMRACGFQYEGIGRKA